jgi:hypothetical protein
MAIATLPYWEVVLGHRSGMYGDVNDFAVPAYVSVWRAIGAGHLPWWTPAVFGGHSMLGAGQYAIFYPFNALFGLLNPVTAYRIWLLLHIWIAAGGAFALSYRLFRSRAGAVVSGVAYAEGGFAVFHLVHTPWIIAVTWLPFAMLGADVVRERWTTRRAAMAAVPLLLIAFGGHPQALWVTVIGVAVYTVVRAALDKWDVPGLARVAGAGALGLGMAAVQLVPLWEFGRTSQRPSLTMAAAFDGSLLPHDLLTLVFPWLYGGSSQGSVFSAPWRGGNTQHEVGMFAGATVVALAAIALVRVRRRDGRAVAALTAVAIVSVLVALGGSTPLGRVIYDVVPFTRSFRVWARTMILLNLAIAVLAGAGLREVLDASRRVVIGLAAATGGLALVALAVPHVGSLQKFLVGGAYGLVARGFPVALLLGLLAVATLTVLYPRVGAVALVGICSLEVVTFAYAAEWRGLSAPIGQLHSFYDESQPPSFGRPYNAPGGVDRWATDTYGFRMVSLAKNLRGVNGYDPLIQKQWSETAAGFAYDGNPTRTDFWSPGWLSDVLRVSTLILNDKITPTDPTWRRTSAVPGLDSSRWERAPRLPEAYLVGNVIAAPLDTIRHALNDPTSPFLTTAYVEHNGENVARLRDTATGGSVISADVLGSGRVVVNAERPNLLVLSHDWEAGWHASVDGHNEPVLRTNGLVLGVTVPRGRHVVRLAFRPPGLDIGLLISVLSTLTLLVAAPLGRRVAARRAPLRTSAPPGQPRSAAAPGGHRTDSEV